MIALEMQSIRRNDAVQVLQRRCYNKVGLPLEEGLPKSCDVLFSLAELESRNMLGPCLRRWARQRRMR